MYMHLPILLGLVFTSVGLERVIVEAPRAAFTMSTLWLTGVGAALWVLGVLGLKLITFPRYATPALYARHALPLLGLALFVVVGPHAPSVVAFGALAIIFLTFSVIESRAWLLWVAQDQKQDQNPQPDLQPDSQRASPTPPDEALTASETDER
jgi:low temperature requirement protein LtrA